MPIYEYECAACGHKLEVLQRLRDEPLRTCPSCSQETLRKLVSAAGFQLKGTGWYETDFKNKGRPAAGKDAGKDGDGGGKDAASGSKDADKSEGKSAGKSDSKTAPSSAPASGD